MIGVLAATITGGLIVIVNLLCITALLINGVSVPNEMWALLASGGGGAMLGGAVATGAAIAKGASSQH